MPEATSAVAGAQAQTNALVAAIQKSITDAVAGAANKISTKFAERVDKELAEMTTSFKATHPAVTQAVTDVVGYTDAVKTTSVAIRDSAKQLKETSAAVKQLPASIRDVRTGLRDSATEAAKLGRDLKQMIAGVPGMVRDLATAMKTNLIQGFNAVRQGAVQGAKAVLDFAKSTFTFSNIQKAATAITVIFKTAVKGLGDAFRANPIGFVVTIITLLVGALILAYQRSTTFRNIVNAAFAAVRSVVTAAMGKVREIINAVWPAVSKVVQVAAKLVRDYVSTYFGAARKVAETVWSAVKKVVTGAVNTVVATVKGVDKVAGIVKGAFDQAKTAVSGALSGIVGFVKGLPGQIVKALGNLGRTLYDTGRSLIDGFLNGIRDMAGSIVSTLQNSVIDKIPGPIRKALGISSPSRVMARIGTDIGAGLTTGIDSTRDRVAEAMTKLVPLPKSATIAPALATLRTSLAAHVTGPLARAAPAAAAGAVTVNVHPRAGQSEYEIGRIAAREVAWAAKR
ncbi:phage tail protein [Amycolatopsis sp. MEPSY49]|uniref:phage tail protein n=1 Tax=Amycolatopsis sp. MEPSY49 TaxID=3151600 RepID=UPI003EF6B905